MKTISTKTIKSALIAFMLFFSQNAIASEDGIFPDFNGQQKSYESFIGNGQWLVMMIWLSECHICNDEAEGYARLHREDNGINVLGLSIDGPQNKSEAEDFIRVHDLPFPNLLTNVPGVKLFYQDQTVSQFIGTPTFLVYNPQGDLVAAKAGAMDASVMEKFIASKSADKKPGQAE